MKPKRHILIVDDSSYNLYVLQELLKELREHFTIDVKTALNGELAVQVVLAQS